MENCVRTASHPFDPTHGDSSDTNSQNPLGGRLGGVRGIRERAIIAMSCKLESVTQPGTQRMCNKPSRCECGSEPMCKCASAPQPYVGVSEVSRKKRKASTKKHKLGKTKRGKKEKASNKRQSASCGCGPTRKRKLLHRDRKFIHSKRKSLRHHEVWEEKERSREMGGRSGCRNRDLISDTEQWEWMRGSCPAGSEEGRSRSGWRNRAVEWDRVARFSPSPSSWGRRGRRLSTEDVDWDRCSVDRWTWGSSDSWEDRGTHRSRSGSRTGADNRDSLGCVWKSAGTRYSSSRNFSSPEWWTCRQTSSPQSVINTRASRCHSPRSCSPCSSTSMSELSWEWSRSSICSGATADGLTVSSCRTSSGAPGLSSEAPQEAKKQSSPMCIPSSGTSCSFSHSSPHRSSFAPTVPVLNTHHCETSASQLKEPNSQSDLGHGSSALVNTSRSGTTLPGLSPSKSLPQKPARVLLLPLIGKLPAFQRKARRKKGLLEKSQEKEGDEEDEAKESGMDPEVVFNSRKCLLDIVESNPSSTLNLCPSQIKTDDKKTAGKTAPPISFTAEEMDKYRLLQEQAREHMQKVLEQTHESADTHTTAQTENCGTSEEQYTPAPLHNTLQPQTRPLHTDTMQTQAHHTLQVSLPLPHVTPQENFTQPMALRVPNLPPLSSLHHIILQRAALSMPPPLFLFHLFHLIHISCNPPAPISAPSPTDPSPPLPPSSPSPLSLFHNLPVSLHSAVPSSHPSPPPVFPRDPTRSTLPSSPATL
ncbi:G patch domain-containing protein 8-like [Cottoperca gobio]|uniref:G patch domain-containing protein 8-like n=1 Tax=Cottoperca gobio TaxID=56716 RepID=A0A6J2R891_COTGO|nr:G patch domain-containing protein 8-like [Cottoperca gobio]